MMEALIRYWKGYVQIRIEGDSPERFLNLCRYHNRILWNLQYEENGITCFLFLKDFWTLKSLIRKSGVRVWVIKRRGVPFFISRNKKRKAAYISAGLSFLSIYILSLFLWDIQFEGNIHYTDDVLMQFLNQKGYVHGMKRSEITCEELEQEIRNAYPDINWVSAMIEGTRLVVKVKENSGVLEEGGQDEKKPGDLVADKDGTVVSVITREGTPKIHAGDSVRMGDVLVSGKVELKNDAGEVVNTHLVQADADVVIEYQDTYEEQFPLLHEIRQYTGEKINYFLQFFDRRFQIMPVKKEANMEIYTEKNQVHLFSNFYIPVYYGTSTVRTYETVEAAYSEEEARTLAEEHWEDYLDAWTNRGADVIFSSVSIDVEDETCTAQGTVTVHESIGVWGEVEEESESQKTEG